MTRPVRLTVRTSGFHPDNRGSIPLRVSNKKRGIFFQKVLYIYKELWYNIHMIRNKTSLTIVRPGFVYPSGKPATTTNDDCEVGSLLTRESWEQLKSGESKALSFLTFNLIRSI